MVRHGCGLECKLMQALFRLKTLADNNNMKQAFMKNVAQNSRKTPLLFTVLRKIKCLAPRASHVRKAGSHVTQRKHLVWSIL